MDLVFNIKKGFQANEKRNNTLILIGESDNSPNNRNVLNALLKAIKLDENSVDIAVFNQDNELLLPEGYSKMLMFGFSEQYFKNTNFTQNRIYTLESGEILLTCTISEMVADKNKKLALWQQLQKMFLN